MGEMKCFYYPISVWSFSALSMPRVLPLPNWFLEIVKNFGAVYCYVSASVGDKFRGFLFCHLAVQTRFYMK